MTHAPTVGWQLAVVLVVLAAVAIGASAIGRLALERQIVVAAETTVVVVSQRLIAAGRILPDDLRERLPSR